MTKKIHSEITLTDLPADAPKWAREHGHNAWAVELRYDARRMGLMFYTGSMAGEPTTSDVVECLVSDSYSADESFEDWASDLDYDQDSRSAYATWEAVRAQNERFRRLLGADFDALVDAWDSGASRFVSEAS